jgi:hypothetical protein
VAVEQRLRQLADRRLAAPPQAVLIVLEFAFKAHPRHLRAFAALALRPDFSPLRNGFFTGPSGAAEKLHGHKHGTAVD